MAEEEIKLVAYTPELQQAVNKVLGLDRGVRYPRGGKRNTLTETVAAGSYEYNGYFKVVETTDESGKTMLKIIDGAKPYSNVAGVSDLGSVGQLTIEKKNSSYLYIYPEWIKDSNPPRYTFKLSTRGNSSIDIEFLLATIDENGIITQRWTDGTIYWGSRFFV